MVIHIFFEKWKKVNEYISKIWQLDQQYILGGFSIAYTFNFSFSFLWCNLFMFFIDYSEEIHISDTKGNNCTFCIVSIQRYGKFLI